MLASPALIPNSQVRHMRCTGGWATITLQTQVGTPALTDRIDGARLGIWRVTAILNAATSSGGATVFALYDGHRTSWLGAEKP